jgi:ATP-binding cassette subfamily B protein
VSFAYPKGDDVLHDVSFTIGRGERVAVVGHTGAGKSTLVNLLCRFHETPHGRILVDGKDVCSLPHAELRRHIAIVQQDVFLFSDTIAANIRMGDDTMPPERVTDMARAVHANRFIDKLPDGYETALAERGSNLSSGQRQLLAFARALAAEPQILILDEATSSVDSETEALIEDATSVLLQGRTSLVIAHRLSTVVGCDRILVMHKGELREQGTHDELMAAKSLYHRLYKLHLSVAT